ncbi:hypothetical protein O0I10_012208 [Lichtheimia ornata]|uniref:Protein kinase domain-containing protein n=1 Tax=Lichtheimia ornata TaxID=688661 RepID=A0AAD7URZ2_9FUNG|nr:uncharacterized protein O0I10_012208 [Lichtheimia ornata]KAJ8652150.1 hypothetical protein O0I10_012208 [Lichtheimia ornata]
MSFQEPPLNPHVLLNTYIDNRTIQLIAVLGVGAYGIVYQARHVKTRRLYAVKLVTTSMNHHHPASFRCREAEIHQQVNEHDNILTFVKQVWMGEWLFLVLEYAPYGDLFSAITHPTSTIVGNNESIRHIFLQILDAVQHCHNHGVAHRDIKPENILVFPDQQVKLADFGLATTQSVSANFGCGSTFYFSPECQGGITRDYKRIKGYSTRPNDVWSLGVILINLTAGRNPWKQATMHDSTFAAYTRRTAGFFKLILPCISNELNAILERVFCLDPALRISLPELRMRVLQCHSFIAEPITAPQPPPDIPLPETPPTHTTEHDVVSSCSSEFSPSTSCSFTYSTAMDMLDYAHGYSTPEEEWENIEDYDADVTTVTIPCWSVSTTSCSSMASEDDDTPPPTTPRDTLPPPPRHHHDEMKYDHHHHHPNIAATTTTTAHPHHNSYF